MTVDEVGPMSAWDLIHLISSEAIFGEQHHAVYRVKLGKHQFDIRVKATGHWLQALHCGDDVVRMEAPILDRAEFRSKVACMVFDLISRRLAIVTFTKEEAA